MQSFIKSKDGQKSMRTFQQTSKGKQIQGQTELRQQQEEPEATKDVKNILKEKFQKKKKSVEMQPEKVAEQKKEGRNWGISNNVSSKKMQELDAN